MWTEALTALSICLLDWTVAQRAMAYTDTIVPELYTFRIPPKWLPFYERKALGTDYFHIVGWPRYLALTWFAWLGFGNPLESIGYHINGYEIWALWCYLGTAALNASGWLVGKILHGKLDAWGWKPRWMR